MSEDTTANEPTKPRKEYFLRVQVFVFRILGIDLYSETHANDRSFITLMTMGPLTVFLLPMGFGVKHHLKDVTMLTDAMAAFLACNITILKFGLFIYYRRDFVTLIYRMRNILAVESKENKIYADIVESENRRDQTLSTTYTICFGAAGLFAGLKPFIIMLLTYLSTGSTTLELPYSAVYPWDYQLVLLYIPTYLWNVTVGYTAVTMSLCVDTLLFSYTHNVCAIFKIAQYKIEHLRPGPEQYQELTRHLHLHQKGLNIAGEMDFFFQPLIFMQFFTSSLQMCVIGFQVAELFPQPQCIYFIAFGVSLLIELFIYSYCGENLKKESANFAMSIFNSEWYELCTRSKSSLCISAMRAQRPCLLNGYFFEANMATFSGIVRTAMSYIMMLRSFSD